MKLNFSIDEIKNLVGDITAVEGSTELTISGVASLSEAEPGDLSFLAHNKYKSLVSQSKASMLLLPEDFPGSPNPNQLFLRVPNPSYALAKICRTIERRLWPKPTPGIHPSAVVDPSASIDPSAFVGPLCAIQAGAKIGPNTILDAGVHLGVNASVGEDSWIMPQARILDFCSVGKRVRIHSGVVIGSDGFGYEFDQGRHQKIPQVGNVIIEDDVELGANTTIDRARLGITRIGEGTKIDNLVQIGHNVSIGKNCIIVAQTGIAGSVIIEDFVVIGGQVGTVGHIRIGQGAMIGSQSGINCDIQPGSNVRGFPPYPHMFANRLEILKKRLPEFFERLKRVEDVLQSLQPQT